LALATAAECRGSVKRDAVLRLLRGEHLNMVSHSLGVTAATLSGWRDAFLDGGEASLATKPASDDVLPLWPVSRAVNNLRNNGAEPLDWVDDPAAHRRVTRLGGQTPLNCKPYRPQ
jgi:hypothetical protein